MSLTKILKFSFIVVILAFFLASCDNAEITDLEEQETTENVILLSKFAKNKSGENEQESIDCFALNFPVTVIYPDGTELSVESEYELYDALDAWFQANEDAEDFPTFKFPLQVTIVGGEVQEVNSEGDLAILVNKCYSYHEIEYFKDLHQKIDQLCFTFEYPLTVLFTDGTSKVADNDDALLTIIDDYYFTQGEDADNPTFEFPVNVLIEDGSSYLLFSDEEVQAFIWTCPEDFDDLDDDYETYNNEACYRYIYPINVSLPDGTVVSAEDENALEAIYNEYIDETDSTAVLPELAFPFNVLLPDGTSQEISSREELYELAETCYEVIYNNDYNFENLCFDVHYPINILLPDGISNEVNNQNELNETVEKWYDENGMQAGDPTLAYPIDITFDNGLTLMLNSDQDLETATIECY